MLSLFLLFLFFNVEGVKHVYYQDGTYSKLRVFEDTESIDCTSTLCKARGLDLDAYVLAAKGKQMPCKKINHPPPHTHTAAGVIIWNE